MKKLFFLFLIINISSLYAQRKMNRPEVLSYETVATFEKGETEYINESILKKKKQQAVILVIFDWEAPWFNKQDDHKIDYSKMNLPDAEAIFNQKKLRVEYQNLDEMNEMLIITIKDPLSKQMDFAKKISALDYVLLVHVKLLPKN